MCATGQTCCNGICADLTSDPANCGACGFKCATIPGVQTATCSNSAPMSSLRILNLLPLYPYGSVLTSLEVHREHVIHAHVYYCLAREVCHAELVRSSMQDNMEPVESEGKKGLKDLDC